jgi:hypothetical protein
VGEFDEVDVEGEESASLDAPFIQHPAKPLITREDSYKQSPAAGSHGSVQRAKEEDAAVGIMEDITGIAHPLLVVATYTHDYSDWEIGARGGADMDPCGGSGSNAGKLRVC